MPADVVPVETEAAAIAARVLRIRYFEEALDPLFEQGRIFGTYHRCIGQEATAVGVTHALDRAADFVVSNHRNHGHYLGFTDDYEGLLAELLGREDGVTGGRGGSQVIIGDRFLSNGILGSTIPVATGIALGLQRRRSTGIAVCFLGDGALCEGVVYEAFNMASLWRLPILYVVEHNGMAQSAATTAILAGSVAERFAAFGIPVQCAASTDVFEILALATAAVGAVRAGEGPRALVIDAARLCAHSKGDDPRDSAELAALRARDPVVLLRQSVPDVDAIAAEAKRFIHRLAFGEEG